MSRIGHIITPQAFEFIRDRVANILQDELDNQFLLSYDPSLDIGVEIERNTPFDESDLPAINVSVDAGTWANKHQGCTTGTYQINIDTVTSGSASPGKSGDSVSAIKGHRIAGLVRCILEDPQYKTLGYSTVPPNKPFVVRVYCSDIKFGNSGAADANNQVTSRVVLTVEAIETADLIIPNLIEGYDTVVKMDNTSQGYFYQGENYG